LVGDIPAGDGKIDNILYSVPVLVPGPVSGVLVRGGGPGMSNPDPAGGGLREKSGGGGGPAIEGEKSEGTSGGIVIGNGCSIGPGGPERNMTRNLTLKRHFSSNALLRIAIGIV
jgi:hypothetical protein